MTEFSRSNTPSCENACADCPVQRKNERLASFLEEQVDKVFASALSSDADLIAGSVGIVTEETMVQATPGSLPEEVEALIAHQVRQTMGETKDKLSPKIDELRGTMAKLASGCKGPLELSGSKDGRREITVTVCASPEATSATGEAVDIQRRRI